MIILPCSDSSDAIFILPEALKISPTSGELCHAKIVHPGFGMAPILDCNNQDHAYRSHRGSFSSQKVYFNFPKHLF